MELGRVKAVLDLLVANHDIFRTEFGIFNGSPVQTVKPAVHYQLVDLRGIEAEDVAARLQEATSLPFDVSRTPLFRCCVIGSVEKPTLFFVAHHLLVDGWSIGLIVQELHWHLFPQGDLEAMYNLAYMYNEGMGTNQNYIAANYLFMKIAVKGSFNTDGANQNTSESRHKVHRQALDMLGDSYYYGRGVKVDYIEAYKWYYLAAVREHPDARRQLQEVSAKMTAEDIATGKARAVAFADHPSEK